MDKLDRNIITATQAGLPLTKEPYKVIAEQLGIDSGIVVARLNSMLKNKQIRRIGVVPNHYKLGYKANAMTVWHVPEEKITLLGNKVGALQFVSHCYQRPQFLPEWPYNLFAMVHGKNRDEVTEKVTRIINLLGNDCLAHELLYSTRILKKTGLRLKRD